MKKTTILACLLALGGQIVFGQGSSRSISTTAQVHTKAIVDDMPSIAVKPVSSRQKRGAAAAFWTETFSNGLSGNNGAWSNHGTIDDGSGNQIPSAAAVWEYRPDTTSELGKAGSRGWSDWHGISAYVKSPTAANGYMIFDSHYLDRGEGSPNIHTGTAPSPHMGVLESPSINCASHPNVQLSFTQYFRKFSSIARVEVSNDGGSTWYPYPLLTNDAVAINGRTAYNDLARVDISEDAGGQADVKIRFVFDGTQQLPGSGGVTGYYFWLLDDVQLTDVPTNDIEIVADTSIIGGKSGFWSKTPKNHANDLTQFHVGLFNYGTANQSNVWVNTTITSGGTEVFNQNSDTLNPFFSKANAVMLSKIFARPATVAKYAITHTLSATATDEDASNNMPIVRNYEVTANEFALDAGVSSSAGYNTEGGFISYGTRKAGYKLANSFEASAADTITSISARISGNASKNSMFKYQILDASGANVLAETADHIFSPADSSNGGRWVKLPLTGTGLQLIPDSSYLIVFYSYAQDSALDQSIGVYDDLSIKQPAGASLFFLPDAGWYGNPNALQIRAYFNENTNPVPYYTINASTNTGGYITPSGAVSVLEHNDKTFNITRIAPAVIDSVIVDGVDQGKISTYKFTDVTANHSIRVVFKTLTQYTINVTSSGQGSVNPNGSVPVTEGDNQAFTFTPSGACNRVDSVLVDGVKQTPNPTTGFTFNNVTANHNLAVFFGQEFNVTTGVAVPNSANITAGGAVCSGGSKTITVTPNGTYVLDSILVNGVNVGAINPLTLNNITGDKNVVAHLHMPVLDGIANSSLNANLSVYPNPSKGNIRIEMKSNEIISSIKISNSLGSVVYNEKVSGSVSTKVISLVNVNNGIYFVEIKAGERTYQKRLVIQN